MLPSGFKVRPRTLARWDTRGIEMVYPPATKATTT
jgi:hypothetical protein